MRPRLGKNMPPTGKSYAVNPPSGENGCINFFLMPRVVLIAIYKLNFIFYILFHTHTQDQIQIPIPL